MGNADGKGMLPPICPGWIHCKNCHLEQWPFSCEYTRVRALHPTCKLLRNLLKSPKLEQLLITSNSLDCSHSNKLFLTTAVWPIIVGNIILFLAVSIPICSFSFYSSSYLCVGEGRGNIINVVMFLYTSTIYVTRSVCWQNQPIALQSALVLLSDEHIGIG